MKLGPGKFFWKLFLGTAALVTVVVATIVALIIVVNDDILATKTTDSLHRYTLLLGHELDGRISEEYADDIQSLIVSQGSNGADGYRITVVTNKGVVLADSAADPAEMENHADREEIRAALAEGIGESTRFSNTINRQMKYVAVRVGSVEKTQGVARVAMQYGSFIAQSQHARRLAWTIALVGLLAAIVLALGLARIWSGPISRITAIARDFSHGDLSPKLRVRGSDEITLLARSINRMRDRLASNLESHYRQRRTLEYLLTQLHEGVIVADAEGRVLLINPAAATLLDVPVSMTDGGNIKELSIDACIAQPEIQEMLNFRLDDEEAHNIKGVDKFHPRQETDRSDILEKRITLEHAKGKVSLLARASDIVLPAATVSVGQAIESGIAAGVEQTIAGRLLVLTNITELTEAIRIKSDFVANASHELRTPLTAIRAGMETLLSIDVTEDVESASRLLGVVDRHSARLEALVDDLLELSRLESSPNAVRPSIVSLEDLSRELHDRFAQSLEAKQIQMDTSVGLASVVEVPSARLLRLVLNNLIDNAVKFTDPGGGIDIIFEVHDHQLRIVVKDEGCGIPAKERDRVFERFYQIERARSGADRGTGLGLSIVRHAVAAMNGAVHLESEVGEGTRFIVELPLRQLAESVMMPQ